MTKIVGYRELNLDEMAIINQLKIIGNNMGEVIKELEAMASVDQRWLAIAKTDLQKGMMALTRSIAKPESF